MDAYQILRRPIRTEKTERMEHNNQYVFEVDPRANKLQIKKAVEELFDVDVVSVNTMVMPGKRRRFGARRSRTPLWKKAVVTLAPGQRIEFLKGG